MIRTANLTGSVSRNAGGLYESVRQLAQALQTKGMEVTVFGTEDEYTQTDLKAWAPVSVKAFRPVGPAKFGYSAEFRAALEAFAPDVTHTHGIWCFPSMATNLYCRRRGVPYVISAHGMLDPWAVRHSRWKKAVAHFLYEGAHLRDATCLRALCEPEARAIRELGLKNPIAVIPNGIDLAEIGLSKPEGGIAPWSGLVEPGRKVLLYLGRIHPKKGLSNLLRAWKQTLNFQTSANGWLLAIAGWDQGGHEAELKRLAKELEIPWVDANNPTPAGSGQIPKPWSPASVMFLGPRFNEGKTECYANCDAFILPSFSEGLPLVVLEAWAHGKPVLMTPACNLPEGFESEAAWPITPSVEGVEQGLRELFLAPSPTLQAMGAKGHALVATRFAWSSIGEEVARLYQWMLGGGDKPACVMDL